MTSEVGPSRGYGENLSLPFPGPGSHLRCLAFISQPHSGLTCPLLSVSVSLCFPPARTLWLHPWPARKAQDTFLLSRTLQSSLSRETPTCSRGLETNVDILEAHFQAHHQISLKAKPEPVSPALTPLPVSSPSPSESRGFTAAGSLAWACLVLHAPPASLPGGSCSCLAVPHGRLLYSHLRAFARLFLCPSHHFGPSSGGHRHREGSLDVPGYVTLTPPPPPDALPSHCFAICPPG